ncbi:MAG: TetR family transcriptional regulator [Xanthomonadales bacterium]|nr:TetR family transcriptional regulator [Xanthomonadales bacterium]
MATQTAPGRPSGRKPDYVRNQLLQAAADLFSVSDFKAVTVKRIADRARVNPAMIHYYFGDKQGLYEALVDGVMEQVFTQMAAVESDQGLEEFVSAYTAVLAENPWWPNFVLREVLYGKGPLRERLLSKFRDSMISRLMRQLNLQVERGELRQDLSPPLMLVSLAGMIVFPFLARNMLQQMLPLDPARMDPRQLAAHTMEVFFNGVRSP